MQGSKARAERRRRLPPKRGASPQSQAKALRRTNPGRGVSRHGQQDHQQHPLSGQCLGLVRRVQGAERALLRDRTGELRAIIGPNGAGKTTMMDIITASTRPDQGEVYFDGAIDLTRKDEAEIAQLGIGRKFRSRPSLKAIRSGTIWSWRSTASAASSPPCSTASPRRTRRASSTSSKPCG